MVRLVGRWGASFASSLDIRCRIFYWPTTVHTPDREPDQPNQKYKPTMEIAFTPLPIYIQVLADVSWLFDRGIRRELPSTNRNHNF